MKTVVIGGGIIGASIAYHLAARGADVTVLTGGNPGGIATAASFAWINAAPGNPRDYFDFRIKAIEDWHRLEGDLNGRLAINWNGSLWWESDIATVQAAVAEHASWGYPIRMVSTTEATEHEPGLAQHPEHAALCTLEGSLSPVETAAALLEAAAEIGARISDDTVESIIETGGRVTGVQTGPGGINADHVVLAAGVASEEIAAEVGVRVPMENSPGFLAQSAPLPPILRGLVLSPQAHVRQNSDGRIIVGEDFGGGKPPDNRDAMAEQLMAIVRGMLADGKDVRLESHSLGQRSIPADVRPIIGPAIGMPGLYVTVMHSGVTLAALAGRLAAEEIVGGQLVDTLAPYRLERFDSEV